MPFNHSILYLTLLPLASIFSNIRVFANELALCISWPKYWSFSFSFSISPSKEYLGLISFRIDWLDYFSVQGTLKSLLQHHNSKASILQCSTFLMFQLSHPYMTTGKTIALTIRTFVGKVMPTSSVIFGAQEEKVCHCFHYFPIYLDDGTGCHVLHFLNVQF